MAQEGFAPSRPKAPEFETGASAVPPPGRGCSSRNRTPVSAFRAQRRTVGPTSTGRVGVAPTASGFGDRVALRRTTQVVTDGLWRR